MIDIIMDNDRKLRDIQQIGRPESNYKIYVEDQVYQRIHFPGTEEKAVYVLMGFTKRTEENYVTFIEGCISVKDISFEGNMPIWNNHVWHNVFGEVKRNYENEVIVGWALDVKGYSPKITEELENIHKEQFGGIHQMMYLLDTMEQEEYFYQMRNNHLVARGGFYIYHNGNLKKMPEMARQEVKVEEPVSLSQPKYRKILAVEEEKEQPEKKSSIAVAVAVLLLVGIIGAGVYQNRIQIPGITKVLETFLATDAIESPPQIILPQ